MSWRTWQVLQIKSNYRSNIEVTVNDTAGVEDEVLPVGGGEAVEIEMLPEHLDPVDVPLNDEFPNVLEMEHTCSPQDLLTGTTMDNHEDRKGTQLGNFNFSDDKEGMISTGNHKPAMKIDPGLDDLTGTNLIVQQQGTKQDEQTSGDNVALDVLEHNGDTAEFEVTDLANTTNNIIAEISGDDMEEFEGLLTRVKIAQSNLEFTADTVEVIIIF